VIWQNTQLRVVWGSEADHPCLVQVIWQSHATELCDLTADEKNQLMHAVFAVETAMKRVLSPKKLNLASLGNWVPHVHWHIIPRWDDDAHWPNSIWAAKQRDASDHGVAHKAELAQAIIDRLQTP
jgi:diadenosine tetraphosphate (Ap4A) HIT family hydrolase